MYLEYKRYFNWDTRNYVVFKHLHHNDTMLMLHDITCE